MGFPVNNFTVLSTLSKGLLKKIPFDFIEDHVFEDINRKLNDFDMFAVVVHDPSRHKEFDNYIKDEFYRLHKLTGNRLLFFSLVQPPAEWLEKFGYDGFGLSRNFLTDWNIGPQYTSASSIGDSIDTLTEVFRVRLGVAPLVILFKSFRDNRVFIFDTGTDTLRKQVELITRNHSSNVDEIAEMMKMRFGHNFYYSLQTYASPIIELLDQMVTEITFKGGNYSPDKVREYIFRKFSVVAGELQNLLNKRAGYPEEFEPNPTELAEMHERNSSYARMKLNIQNVTYRENQLVERMKEFFDEDSIVYLRTAVTIKELLEGVGQQRGVDSLDYACIGIEFGRAIENEMNLSLSHFVRKQLMIQLPEYFYRHQAGLTAKMIAHGARGEFEINFNEKNNFNVVQGRDWAPVELGKILKAVESIMDPDMVYLNAHDELTKIFGDAKLKILKDEWSKIRNIRNKCAHTSSVTLNDINQMERAFHNLTDSGIFEVLSTLKNGYRDDLFFE